MPEPAPARSHALPLLPTPLIGREEELAEICGCPRDVEARLLTLTGAPGTGKTRLALEAAAALGADFDDGVVFVSLAAARDTEGVVLAIARALGAREAGGLPLLEQLREYLQSRNLLLILDNFEQVVEAAPTVADLLAASPRLTVLVTSRAPLRVSGEREVPVAPLALPPVVGSRWSVVGGEGGSPFSGQHSALEPERLLEYAAVQLFCGRAAAVRPDFKLTSDNAGAVAAICRRLDGLPLAIELAAQRANLLSPAAMLTLLVPAGGHPAPAAASDALEVLADGARDLPVRQQSLRDAIAWSYELLTTAEQELFRLLSVFAGGFTLAAAIAVLGSGSADASGTQTDAQAVTQGSVFRLLGNLVSHSLVVADTRSEEPRFDMLETVREYAVERLAAIGEPAATRARHAGYFLALVESAAEQWNGPEEPEWLDRLEADYDNLRVALRRAIAAGDAEAALRLGASLARFWYVRGYLSEARRWLDRALALDGEASPALRAQALNRAAEFALRQTDHAAARMRLAQSLAIARAVDETALVAGALHNLGVLAYQQADYATARAVYGESLVLQRESGDRRLTAGTLNNLATLAWRQGDYAAAGTLYTECLLVHQEYGNSEGVGQVLNNLGLVHQRLGDVAAARRDYEESLAIRRRSGNAHGTALTLINLGSIDEQEGDLVAAHACYEESLALRRELGDRNGIAQALMHLAAVQEQQGDAAGARPRFEESLALRRELGDRSGVAWALGHLGRLARRQTRLTAARRLHSEALALFQEIEERSGVAMALRDLANLTWREGDVRAARQLYRESLSQVRELGERRSMAAALEGLAAVTAAEEPERAIRLLAAADSLRTAIQTPVPPLDRDEHERLLGCLRETLGDGAFERAWAGVRATSPEAVVAEALAEQDEAGADVAPVSSVPPPPLPDGLTPREGEVLGLLADGLSHREIAEALVVSVRTVGRHVDNIYGKIGVHDRRRARQYARDHDLLASAPATGT